MCRQAHSGTQGGALAGGHGGGPIPLTLGLVRATRQTDGKVQDEAIGREVEAVENTERFQSHTRTVDDHSTESVGGIKKIEALGALKLLSGGSASLAAVDDLHQATGRDLNLVVGQKHNTTVGGDMQERTNVLQILCDLMDVVQEMNTQLAEHVHGATPIPNNSTAFATQAAQTSLLSAELKPIILAD